MAVTRISELTPITTPTPDDVFIINDGSVTTNKITYANLLSKITTDVQGSSLVFTDSVELSSVVTLSGVISVTGAITFTGTIGGIDIGQLDDVDTTTVAPTDGQVLLWNGTDSEWVPGSAPATAATASSFTFDASLIPDTNSTYDLGSAELKIRHLYLSNNSIKFEGGDLGVNAGNLQWQGEPVLPTTLANILTVLGVLSFADNGTALGGGLLVGDVYYNTTSSRLVSVTA